MVRGGYVELVDIGKLWLHGVVWWCLIEAWWELAHVSVRRHVGRGLATLHIWWRTYGHLLALHHWSVLLHVRLQVLVVVLHLLLQHAGLHALHRATHATHARVARRVIRMLVLGREGASVLCAASRRRRRAGSESVGVGLLGDLGLPKVGQSKWIAEAAYTAVSPVVGCACIATIESSEMICMRRLHGAPTLPHTTPCQSRCKNGFAARELQHRQRCESEWCRGHTY